MNNETSFHQSWGLEKSLFTQINGDFKKFIQSQEFQLLGENQVQVNGYLFEINNLKIYKDFFQCKIALLHQFKGNSTDLERVSEATTNNLNDWDNSIENDLALNEIKYFQVLGSDYEGHSMKINLNQSLLSGFNSTHTPPPEV